MKRIVSYFLQGLVFLVPIFLTIWVVGGAFYAIDGAMTDLFGIKRRGLGVPILLLFVTGVGFLGSNLVGRRLVRLPDLFLKRLPFVKLLYGALRDLMNAFVGEKKRFDKPVLVDLTPGGHVRVLGFVTRQTLAGFGLAEHAAVYLPQAYNFAGQVIVVPTTAVQPLAVESGAVMTFIVSGGVTGA
jgi:uncharacterized membrane protein